MSLRNRKLHAKCRLDDLISRLAQPLTQDREPYWRLIHAVRASSGLLVPFPDRGRTDPRVAERVVHACVRMAGRYEAWQRAPEVWKAPGASPFVQFRFLVRHLFDQYSVPSFMPPVWMRRHEKPWELELYLHLAAGRSIRQFSLPMSFRPTKRAAAFFMEAPDDLVPIEALRWSQIRSLGGDARLARLLVKRTVLRALTEHEGLWESVIRFLVRNGPISADEIMAIVRFVHQQRFQPAEIVWGPGAGQQSLQPEFAIRGRSLMSLRRQMANWRSELLIKRPTLVPPTPGWVRTDIRPFHFHSRNVVWTIDELLSARELRAEGGIMQHCVATYIHACARRCTSIWSMKVEHADRSKRVLTIEVAPATRTIKQANGKRNSPPTVAANEMLRRWAVQEGLRFRA